MEHREEIKSPPSNPRTTFPISSAPFNFHPPNFQLLNVVQKSLCSNVDKFMKIVDIVRSQNAVLDKVLSFSSSYLQNCFQFQIRGREGEGENVYMLRNDKFAAILPGGESVAGMVVANGIFNFLNIYNTLLIVRIVLTWFPTAPSVIVTPLSTICDPYLNVFRGLIPPLGGTLDLSPILAFLVLNAFTSTAAALPAELPSQTNMSSSQKKWSRRLAQSNSNKPGGRDY